MLQIRITNLLIFLFTTVCFILNFHKDGEWKAANGLYALRYFTILSNLLSALAALLVALNVSEQGLPFGIWLLKWADDGLQKPAGACRLLLSRRRAPDGRAFVLLHGTLSRAEC